MELYNNLLGWSQAGSTTDRCANDTPENLKKNLSKQPADWYYQDKEIYYKWNSTGHRCKEISDIDLSNYILTIGCSHTVGVGLELEKSYPYVLSQLMGCDYYNLAIDGSGIDTIQYNLVVWFFTMLKKPRALIIQWPDRNRFIATIPNGSQFYPRGTWSIKEDPNIGTFLISGEDTGFFSARKILAENMIKLISACPIYQFAYSKEKLGDAFSVVRKDVARDLDHPGIKSNLHVANTLYQLIK